MINHLVIFAGAGELPLIAAESAKTQGIKFSVYHIGEAELDATLLADASIHRRTISLGTITQTFAFLKEDKISHVVLLGKVEKQRMLQDVKRDAGTEEIYNSAVDRRDDSLFLKFAEALDAMGITIMAQKTFLQTCFLPAGIPTLKKPDSTELKEDIEFGYEISRRVGSLDIGQTAVVFRKMILAVEAIEGTDAAIARAGEIARRQGGVVCKTAKASQDERFDLPAVGIRTLETMHSSGMQAIVIEAAATLVVNPAAFVTRANQLGLIVVAR